MINSFHLLDYQYLFFDIYYKNNNICLICPVNLFPFEVEKIFVFVDNSLLELTRIETKKNDQQSNILFYNYVSELVLLSVLVKYKDKEQTYEIENIKTTKNNFLGISTLFKNDYALFPIYYQYYKDQGVTLFIMYYNGILTDEIRQIFNKNDVLLIEWNFQYWSHDTTYESYAQIGQLQHSLFRYGKDLCEYIIFCDFDEYFSIPNRSLINFVKEYPEVDVFGFCNKWSKTLDGKIPDFFPSTFFTSRMHKYGIRSKNIFKTDTLLSLEVHVGNYWNKEPVKIIKELRMFHFYNWSGKTRTFTAINDIIEV
jgi:hypothetical protein